MSSKSHFHSQSELQAYGWRTFCVELMCGMVAIAWYLLSLAEKTTLRGLTRLEQFAASGSGDISDNEKASNVLFQDEGITRAQSRSHK